ncbi:type I restriction endonuclease subunit S [Rhodobacter sphaeroides]|uniref:restriction endonuclease subunit S n=1 Tax=Cereibacter sphaeroides TaxID=1063 RepID=UPI00132536B9|nr:restriction endonuclease subunit S [Cereibacter sphaeroides]MWP39802.1 type I restriction endonuclease subunit S [Cereibacter sphaeroides]
MRRYPAYKDSGVEWLGEVPEGWEVKCLRMIADELQTGPFGSQLHTEDYVTAGVPIVNPSNILDGQIVPDDEIGVDEATALRLSNHALLPGDIILGRRGELGRCAVVPDGTMPLLCGTGSLRIRLKSSQALPDFIAECIRTPRVREWLSLQSVGSTMDNLNTAIVGKIQIALPSLPEQRAITAFLNRETAKIDALVEEQRRLIALLAEKRQAVLNHAVTRGLNPDAPLKPSGIDWLGDIPEGWEVRPLKSVATVQTGIAKGKAVDPLKRLEIPYVRVANVQDGYLDLAEVATIEIEANQVDRYLLRPGDVLMNEGGDFDKLGRGAIWGGEVSPCIHQNHVFAVRPADISSGWLSTIIGSDYAKFYFMTRSKQSTNLASISSTNLMNLPVLMPGSDEQQGIIAFLREEEDAFDALTSTATTAIALLQERRAALISAAVTGKIDVRDLSSQSLSECLEPA